MALRVFSCKAKQQLSGGDSNGNPCSNLQGYRRLLIAFIGVTLLSSLLDLLSLSKQGDEQLLVTNTTFTGLEVYLFIFLLIAAVITKVVCAISGEEYAKVFPVVCFCLGAIIVLIIGAAIESSKKAKDPVLSQPAVSHSTDSAPSIPAPTSAPAPTPTPTPTPSPSPSEVSPAASFSAFYEAWRSNDVPGVKAVLSKNHLDELTALAAKHNMAMDEVLGMFLRGIPLPSDAPPATRNEIIRLYVATLEAWNEKANSWVSVPFIKENNQWKLEIDKAVRGASMNGIFICTPTRAQSHIHPRHWLILQPWLAGKGRLRIATTNDFLNKSRLAEVEKREGKNFHPYYLVRDFDGDRKEDFAVGLINEDNYAKFAVAVFNGPFSFKSRAPAFFKDGFDLGQERFFLTETNRLGFGAFAGADDHFYLEPSAKGYKLKNSADDLKLETERSSGQIPKPDKQNL